MTAGDLSVRASTALWGAALAVAIAPSLQRPAAPGALPGGIVAEGLSHTGPLLQFVALLVGTALFAWVGGFAVRYAQDVRWARIAYCVAVGSAPVSLIHFGSWRHVLLHGVAGVAILALRRLQPRFSRDDAVLLPVALSWYFALLDIGFGRTIVATALRAALIVFLLRLVIGIKGKTARPALAFAAAPLAFILQAFNLHPAFAIVWLAATPFALMFVRGERLARFAAYVAYPLIVAAYPLAIFSGGVRPVVDFYEDVHDVLPGAEMVRGEVPYRDIVPIHGFISDGGLAFASMKLGASNLGAILRTRLVVASLTTAAIYIVALAVTGAAEAALLAAFLAIALFPSEVIWFRPMPALFALACCAAGTRLRSRKWFAWAGVLVVVAGLVSLDFALYTLAVALLASIRGRQLKAFALGAASAIAGVLLLFAIGGFALDFLRVTFGEILSTRGVYMIGPLELPDCLRSLSALAARIGDPECLGYLLWAVALIGSFTVLAQSPLRASRRDALWYVGLWLVLAGASYVERRHLYFLFAAAPFAVGLVLRLAKRSREAALVVIVLLILLARPFSHAFDVATPLWRASRVPIGASESIALPRAKGAVFDPQSVRAVEATRRFVAASLRPGGTFFDFANAGLLYYLLDRNCPIRQMQVPTYESVAAQNEVIAALERNHSVCAALIVFPTAYSSVDGVKNRDRAPLVWKYLETHFAPSFSEDGVEMWLRKP